MSDTRHMADSEQPNAPRITMPTEKEIFGDREFSEIDVGLLQMQILWILSHKSTHGYELMKVLNEIKKTKIGQGTLYPALKSLEDRGLVKGENEERKINYEITEKGRNVMNETCMDFSRTFFGIFQSFVCQKCMGHDHKHNKNETINIGEKK